MASEITLCTALGLFNDPSFRQKRQEEFPGTIPEFDARAATFVAMDSEGRFDSTVGAPMSQEESDEFKLISSAVLKMAN